MTLALCDNDISIGISECMDNLSSCILDSILEGLYTLQVRLGSPNSIERTRLDIDEIKNCKTLLDRYPMFLFCRSPPTYNLAGSRTFLAWNGNVDEDTKITKLIRELQYEIDTISDFGGKVIMNIGCHINKKNGLRAVYKSISKLHFPKKSKLLFENSLDERSNIGVTFDDLLSVYKNTSNSKKSHIGFALNLTNLFVNGLYDMSDIHIIFADFMKLFGLEPDLIILGDTTSVFGSKRIYSCLIGNGTMWKNKSLVSLLELCRVQHLPRVTDNIDNISIIREIKY